jgi:pSer/pThr/pTyr-binding forkhead associated (FHA) protein
MAYLVFSTDKGKELGSRRLDGPLTIGRSPDCDVSLHDILLSRNHCRLERTRDGWVVTDLGSKNGTVIDGRPVTRHALRPGEVIRIGRVNVTFRAGKLAPSEEKKERLVRPKRPDTPFNASEGTVAGFKYESPAGERSFENFPTPKPVLTESGRFVAQDILAEAEREGAAPRRESSSPSPMDSTIVMAPVPRSSRPKTPSIDLDASAVTSNASALAPTLPHPPRPPLGLRLRHLAASLGRGLRRPLARWAALLT